MFKEIFNFFVVVSIRLWIKNWECDKDKKAKYKQKADSKYISFKLKFVYVLLNKFIDLFMRRKC